MKKVIGCVLSVIGLILTFAGAAAMEQPEGFPFWKLAFAGLMLFASGITVLRVADKEEEEQ